MEMNLDTKGVWPWAYYTDITTAIMGRTKGSTKDRVIIWETVPYGERGDTGVPGIPNNHQHRGGCSSNGGPNGSLRTSEGTQRICLGSG